MIAENKDQKTIKNRYKVLKELGKGGMGTVYLVEDGFNSDSLLALKTINTELLAVNKDAVIKNFKKEFTIVSRLVHPNLVQVYDFGYDPLLSEYFLTMEYLEGETLLTILNNRKELELEEALEIIVQISRALEFIHTKGVIYRDLKLENIVINNKGEIKLLDFGLADFSFKKRKNKGFKGTLAYAAPEVFLKGEVDSRSDIFSLGILFYKLLTGNSFYKQSSISTIASSFKSAHNFNHDYLLQINGSINDVKVRKLISSLIQYNKEDRIANCSLVIATINKVFSKNFEIETSLSSKAYISASSYSGRKQELNLLKKLIEESSSVLHLVSHWMDNGKKQLFADFKKFCQLENIPFIHSRCNENVAAYSSFTKILKYLISNCSKKLLSRYKTELSFLVPDYIENVVKPDNILEAELLEKISDFILKAQSSNKQKLIFYLDEIHEIDDQSLSLLKKILLKNSRTGKSNLYILCSLNSESTDMINYFAELTSKIKLNTIKLKPISDIHTKAIFRDIFGKRLTADILETAYALKDKVGGNLFFLQEIFKNYLEEKILERKAEGWIINKKQALKEIPENIEQIIQKKISLEKPDKNAQQLINIGSIIEDSLSKEDFSLLSGLSGSIIDSALEKLVASEILDKVEESRELRFIINNSIIRNFYIDNMSLSELEVLHGKAGEHYEQNMKDFDQNFEKRALHFSLSDQQERSLNYFEKAGKRAFELNLFAKAESFFAKYINNCIQKSSKSYFRVKTRLANCKASQGNWREARKIYEENIADSEYSELKAENLKDLGLILHNLGEREESQKVLVKALEFFQSIADKNTIGEIYGIIGINYLKDRDFTQAEYFTQKKVKLCKETENLYHEALAYNNLGNIFEAKGDNKSAKKYYKLYLKMSEKLNNLYHISIATGNLGVVYYNLKNYEKAVYCYKRYLKEVQKLGDKQSIAIASGNLAEIEFLQGDYKKGIRHSKTEFEISKEIGDYEGVCSSALNLGNLYYALKDLRKAKDFYKIALEISQDNKAYYYYCQASLYLSVFYQETGNIGKAEFYLSKISKYSDVLENDLVSVKYNIQKERLKLVKKEIEPDDFLKNLISFQQNLKDSSFEQEVFLELANYYALLHDVKLKEAIYSNLKDRYSKTKEIKVKEKLSIIKRKKLI